MGSVVIEAIIDRIEKAPIVFIEAIRRRDHLLIELTYYYELKIIFYYLIIHLIEQYYSISVDLKSGRLNPWFYFLTIFNL